MMIMRTTPKILKATERYVISIGRKREELTEEQWNFMVNYIKACRISILSLAIIGIINVAFTLMYFYFGQGFAKGVLPPEVVTISFEEQGKSVSFSPEEMRRYLNRATDCYLNAGMGSMLSIFFLTFFIGNFTFIRVMNRKTHRILLSRPIATEIAA